MTLTGRTAPPAGRGLRLALLLLVGALAVPGAAAVHVPVPDSLGPRTEVWTEFALGLQAELDGDYKTALAHYRAAEEAGARDAELATRLAACLLELRRFDAALAAAQRAVGDDSLQAEAHWILGALAVLRREPETAIRSFRRSVAIQPDIAKLSTLAGMLERTERYEEALEVITQMTELSAMPRIRLRRARLLEQLGRDEEALEAYWKLVEQDPGLEDAVAALQAITARLERHAEALRLQRLLVEHFPDDKKQRWSLIRLLVQEERWPDAEVEIGRYRERFPRDPLPLLQLGLVAYRRGENERALALFDEAWALGPDNPRIIRWRMRLRLAENQIDSARVSAQRLLRLRPDDAEAWRVSALALAELGAFDAALRALHAWAAAAPESAVPWMLTSGIQRSEGRLDEALTAIEEAVRRAPEDLDIRLEQAAILELLGDNERAENILRPIVAAAPDFARGLNFLGYLWVDQGVRLDEAQPLIERAVELEPENPAFLDSLGWLWYKKGDLAQAEQWLQRAVERGGRHPEIFAHLARVQIERGRLAEAEETLRLGLAWEPQDAALQEMLEELRSP
jgi:tetratricopeptide (TPR) repeat protein